MIKANELRIGNWVLLDGFFHQFEIIDFAYGNQNISIPIPLTPEILEKCGFEYDENDDWYVLDMKNGTSFSHILLGLTHYYGSIELMWVDVLREIKYLHELQNLVFALTGEELIFNPATGSGIN